MFHHRSTSFAPHISAIEGHLRALEGELGQIGRKAGRRASNRLSDAGDQIGDAIAPILSDLIDRIRNGRRLAGDEAARYGNEAFKAGTRIGNDTLSRIATEAEHRPLVTLAVAIGVGILIGMAGRRR
jgi:hypothetical protein